MAHLTVGIDVAAAPERVWPLLAEFRHWADWGPSIRAVESAAHTVAPGVAGRVQTVAGVWLPFVITQVTPGRSWDWSVAGIPATGHRLLHLPDGSSRVEFTVSRWLAPYTVVLRAALRRIRDLAEEG